MEKPQLEGSVKQIAWAEDIREELLANLHSLLEASENGWGDEGNYNRETHGFDYVDMEAISRQREKNPKRLQSAVQRIEGETGARAWINARGMNGRNLISGANGNDCDYQGPGKRRS